MGTNANAQCPEHSHRTPVAVVDDDASFLRSVGRLLRTEGYEVETFASARDFLETVPAGLPGCLVLDVHMPEMTGLELQDRLAEKGLSIPVIFLTAYDTPQTREHAQRAGCFGLLLKPFDKKSFLGAISEALRHPPSETLPDRPPLLSPDLHEGLRRNPFPSHD